VQNHWRSMRKHKDNPVSIPVEAPAEQIVQIEERDREFVVSVNYQVMAVFDTRELAEAWVDGFQHGEMVDAP
jgi:hypothetical protein